MATQDHPRAMGAPGGPSGRHPHEAWVGDCSAVDCEYNEQTHCHAPNIRVIKHVDHADCGTYEPKTSTRL
ncbi:MAG: DUF1540 domain-containing protein [Chloroflexi bacterium]|nr:DUF1540 domain-containing protein [Chloroflexota bacterium]